MKAKILEIIDRIKNKHLNNPTVSVDLDEITTLLLSDVNQTIKVINELDEESIKWISFNFEELSYKFQSKEFVECVKNVAIKYPNRSALKQDVQEAIEAYYGDEENYRQAMEKGANDFLTKPLDFNILKEKLKKIMNNG